MKIIEVKAGERRRIICSFSNSTQKTYHFRAETPGGGGNVSGIIEVRGSRWLFPKPPVTRKLEAENHVDKGMWDTLFSVFVIPDCDVKITMTGSHFTNLLIYMAMASVIIAIAGLVLFLSIS